MKRSEREKGARQEERATDRNEVRERGREEEGEREGARRIFVFNHLKRMK